MDMPEPPASVMSLVCTIPVPNKICKTVIMSEKQRKNQLHVPFSQFWAIASVFMHEHGVCKPYVICVNRWMRLMALAYIATVHACTHAHAHASMPVS